MISQILNTMKPIFHIQIGERVFHVVPSDKNKLKVLNVLMKQETAFIDNDTGEVLGLDKIQELYEEKFGENL